MFKRHTHTLYWISILLSHCFCYRCQTHPITHTCTYKCCYSYLICYCFFSFCIFTCAGARVCAHLLFSSFQIFHAKINPPGLHLSLCNDEYSVICIYICNVHILSIAIAPRAFPHLYIVFWQFHCFTCFFYRFGASFFFVWKSQRIKRTTNTKQRQWFIDFL